MNVVAPCPKKPSGSRTVLFEPTCVLDFNDVQEACLELQQILLNVNSMHHFNNEQHLITRTGNPLIQDSSFIPLHQAVSQLQVTDNSRRPRSYSVGDSPNQYIVQPTPCKPVF